MKVLLADSHLQGADDLAERLKVENESLKQQLDECRHRYTEPPATPPENHKVTPLDKKRAGGRSNISDEIKQQLTALEVPLNSTLKPLNLHQRDSPQCHRSFQGGDGH